MTREVRPLYVGKDGFREDAPFRLSQERFDPRRDRFRFALHQLPD